MFVKICGITRPQDAKAAVDAGADAIGLNFVPTSPRCIDGETARSILTAAGDGVMTVGVFRDHPAAEVIATVEAFGLDAAQLHGEEPPELTGAVAERVQTVIKVFTPATSAAERIDDHPADIVMVDAATPGGGVPFDWDSIGDLAQRHDLLLAGGLDPDNVAEAIRRVGPWGVDVASGVDGVRPHKDADKIARFVAAARG